MNLGWRVSIRKISKNTSLVQVPTEDEAKMKGRKGRRVGWLLRHWTETKKLIPISCWFIKFNLTLKKGNITFLHFLSELFSVRHPLSCILDLAMKINIISASQQGLWRRTRSVLAHTPSNLHGWGNKILAAVYYSERIWSELRFPRTSIVQAGYWARLNFFFPCIRIVLSTKVCDKDFKT